IVALENAADVNTGLAIAVGQASTVTDQPACDGKLVLLVNRRDSMMRCQRHDLIAPTVEEWVRADNKRANLEPDNSVERQIEFIFTVCMQDMDILFDDASGLLKVIQLAFSQRAVRVQKDGNQRNIRDQLT